MVAVSAAEANKILDKLELPLGVTGFVLGAIGDEIKAMSPSWDDYPTDVKAKIIVRKVVGRVTGITLFKKDFAATSLPEKFKFNPLGFCNKFLGMAIGAWLYGEMGLPYANTVKKILWPLGVGGAIGGLFDPPLASVTPKTSNQHVQISGLRYE